MQPRKNTWPLPLRADRGEVGHRLGLQRVRRRGGPQALSLLSCGRVAQALASPCVCGDRVGTWVGHEWVWAWWFEAGLCIHLGIRVYSRVFNLRAGKVQNTRIHLAILVYSACRVELSHVGGSCWSVMMWAFPNPYRILCVGRDANARPKRRSQTDKKSQTDSPDQPGNLRGGYGESE